MGDNALSQRHREGYPPGGYTANFSFWKLMSFKYVVVYQGNILLQLLVETFSMFHCNSQLCGHLYVDKCQWQHIMVPFLQARHHNGNC